MDYGSGKSPMDKRVNVISYELFPCTENMLHFTQTVSAFAVIIAAVVVVVVDYQWFTIIVV